MSDLRQTLEQSVEQGRFKVLTTILGKEDFLTLVEEKVKSTSPDKIAEALQNEVNKQIGELKKAKEELRRSLLWGLLNNFPLTQQIEALKLVLERFIGTPTYERLWKLLYPDLKEYLQQIFQRWGKIPVQVRSYEIAKYLSGGVEEWLDYTIQK